METNNKPYEKSYLDMMNELYEALDVDFLIPSKDKEKIMQELQKLFELVSPYSA